MRKTLFVLILGGLLSSFLIPQIILSYSQTTTHPALTSEVVDFYNLYFPDRQIRDREKLLLIKGSIDEDALLRSTNHFYDPVYNQGWLGNISSKIWAYSSNVQQSIAGSLLALNPFSFGDQEGNHPLDFSYERALLDYARGNEDRAFEAFGHVLHLLEDSTVPAHTRNDTHLPFHSATRSPYEHITAQWNLGNLKITKNLYNQGEKPILFNSLNNYFDSIAGYSNGYFFSEDTIGINRYGSPKIVRVKGLYSGDKNWSLGLGLDRNGREFKLALLNIKKIRNLLEIKEATLIDETMGTAILDGYWDKLSKDFILHGAGALKMFLDQAEEVKKEYEKQQALNIEENKGFFARLRDAFGNLLSTEDDNENNEIDLVQDVLIDLESQEVIPEPTPEVNAIPLPLLPVLPEVTPEDENPDEVLQDEDLITTESTPTPTPTPFVTEEGLPIEPENTESLATRGQVVINEIAWSGTWASAFDEWIELYNSDVEDIDITDWTLISEDGSIKIVLSGVIKANEYFLLERTDDNTISNITADQIYTGNLNNAGEVLILSNKDGGIVDIIGKSAQAWFGGNNQEKLSMERVDASIAKNVEENWTSFSGSSYPGLDANNNFINGTPKSENSIVITTATGGIGGDSTEPPTESPSPSPSPSPFIPSPGTVVINEIAWMGTGASANDEWIELYNTSSKSIDISDWVLKAVDGTPDIVFASASIGPFDYYLLERTDDTTISDILADQIYTDALKNSGEVLELRDFNGDLHDVVGLVASGSGESESWYEGDNATKSTMERKDPKLGNISTNWHTNDNITKNGLDFDGNIINGTPRAQNSLFESSEEEKSIKPPDAVIDLSIDPISNFGDVALTWTTPNDSDSKPASLSYDLRYSLNNFDTETDWENAEKVEMADVLVGINGSQASVSFHIFDYEEKYYIALKTSDGTNISDISNIIEYTIKSAQFGSISPMFGHNSFHDLATDSISLKESKPSKSWEFGEEFLELGQPVIGSDGTIYVGAKKSAFGYLYAINKDGVKKWRFDSVGKASIPAVAGDNFVYFGTFDPGNSIIALDSIGSKSWKFVAGDRVDNITQASNGDIYFTTENGKVTAIYPDGSLKWQKDNSFAFNYAPVVPGNGTVYMPGFLAGNPKIWAYNEDTGDELSWSPLVLSSVCFCKMSNIAYDESSDKIYTSLGGYIVEIEGDGSSFSKVYVAPGGANTTLISIGSDALYAGFNFSLLNPASGSMLFAIDKTPPLTLSSIKWSYGVDSVINTQIPLDKDENLYFSTKGGIVYSLDKNGVFRWSYSIESAHSDKSPLLDNKGGIIWGDSSKILRLE